MSEGDLERFWKGLMKAVEEAYRREGVDPDTVPQEDKEALARETLERLPEDATVRAQEMLDADFLRIMHEEFDRLLGRHPETRAVSQKALYQAVVERVNKEHGYIMKPRRPEPPRS
jgi:hypothetical protein